jgi:hypothetical protein
MIKHYGLICFLLTSSLHLAFAQKQYSYMTDRVFKDQLDLYGYNFVPNQMEIPNETQKELKMGEYSFGVLGANLYVNGGDIKGVYSINNIDPADFGYKLNLMNARDPTIQGHLKIILTKYGHVDALVFKRSTKEKEIVFYLPEIPNNLRLVEKEYFTDRFEIPLKDIDELWGQSFRPFLRIHDNQNIQERLQMKDSTIITFIEKIIRTEKKQRGKKKTDKEEDLTNTELVAEDDDNEEVEEEVVAVIPEPEPEPEPEPKPKAEPAAEAKPQGRAGRERQKFGGYQNARSYDSKEEEEVVVEKPAPTPTEKPMVTPAKNKEVVPSPAAEQKTDDAASPPDDGKVYKITKEYFLKVRSILTYDDGTSEDVEKMYPIKKIVEREDVYAAPEAERFQLEISLKKGEPIYLYLTSERTISSLEVEGKTYLMRGH